MEGQGDREGQFVIALIENCTREVGLAALDLRTATLHLSQFIETSRFYQSTLTLLQFFDPTVIILSAKSAAPEGMVGLDNLVDHCSNARKVPLVRGCFDDTKTSRVIGIPLRQTLANILKEVRCECVSQSPNSEDFSLRWTAYRELVSSKTMCTPQSVRLYASFSLQ